MGHPKPSWLEGVAVGGEDVDLFGGVLDGVGAEEIGVAGQGFAGLAVYEETDLFQGGEVGVEGGDDGAEGEVFGFDAGGVGVGEGFGEVDDG